MQIRDPLDLVPHCNALKNDPTTLLDHSQVITYNMLIWLSNCKLLTVYGTWYFLLTAIMINEYCILPKLL
jgi:hypothetical protein